MKRIVLVILGMSLLASCAASGTKPHDMSVQEHRKAAEDLEREAREYNERADAVILDETYVDLWTLAVGYQSHADAHRKAARVLEGQNDPEACVGHPREHVETCPLAAYKVLDVEQISQGVRVLYDANAGEEFEGHLKCHHAHMSLHEDTQATHGSCPLKTEVQINVVKDDRGAWVTFTSAQAEEVEMLRQLYVKTPSGGKKHVHPTKTEP